MKTMKKLIIAVLALTAFTAQAQEDQAKVQAVVDYISANCGAPTYGQDSAKAITNISLYREFKKQGDNYEKTDKEKQLKYYKDAYAGWKYAFVNAPSSKLYVSYYDAKDIMSAFMDATEDEAAKAAYQDTLLAIYDIRANCFEPSADLTMRKAFDWYSYRNKGNEAYIFDLFNQTVVEFDKEEGTSSLDISPAFLSPWMIMAIKANKTAKSIDEAGVFEVFDKINEIADHNMSNGNDAGKYKGSADNCYSLMEKYGYLDPETISRLASEKYNANPDDLSTQIKVYKMLKAAKLYDDPIFFPVAEKVYQQQPSSALATFLAKKAAEKKDYTTAIKYIQEANESETDEDAKAQNLLTIAQFYQAKGDFSSARTYANKAAALKAGWGEPYILIGRLYAASGSKCGTGTGFESQAVVWAAMDMWNKAKNVDSSVSGEAQSLINKYYQYMPSKSDLFLRNMSPGDSFSIGCWIGTTTTVRAAE